MNRRHLAPGFISSSASRQPLMTVLTLNVGTCAWLSELSNSDAVEQPAAVVHGDPIASAVGEAALVSPGR